MDRTTIAAIFADQEALGGQTVTVCGWARTIRDMKTFGFIELNDGSCFKNLQVVMDANVLENYKEIAGQNVGAAPVVVGQVVLTPGAKQPLEVKAASIAVEGPSAPDYPFRRSATGWSSCAPSSICAPRTNLFPPPSGCGAWPPMPSTASSRTRASSMSTHPSSPPATARAPARCSR